MSDVLGVLGVGHLAGYLIQGLRQAGFEHDVVLSPRNRDRALDLSRRYDARLAADNGEVVSSSNVVLLATRPHQAVDAVRGLPWRKNHLLISVAAGVSLESLSEISSPAEVVRAMPVSCAAIGESPTSIYPEHAKVRTLFEALGSVVALPDEKSFEAASVVGAFYAWNYALLEEVVRWGTSRGLSDEASRHLFTQAMRGATGMVQARPDRPIAEMLESLATPGGLTELGLDIFRDSKALARWSEACEAVLHRLQQGWKNSANEERGEA
jgi:pyrroline-5-carboxylate reductase